jgi:hypothetical protein
LRLEDLMNIVDEAYDDRLIRQYFEEPEEQHGDTLAEFIVRELRDCFDPDLPDEKQIAAAIHLMTTAIHQLSDVVGALEEAAC